MKYLTFKEYCNNLAERSSIGWMDGKYVYGKGRYTKEEIDMLLPIVGKLVNGNDKKTYDKNPDGTKSWMQD